jgi:proteic killer suppression protein/toxin YoeB
MYNVDRVTILVRKESYVEIIYDDNEVEKLFNDFEMMKRKKGAEITRKIKNRYDFLVATINFKEYLDTTAGKPHALQQNRKGQYAVSVDKNKRLILEPITENNDLSSKALEKCEKVIIKGVIDYHGGKETTYIP